MSLSDGGSPGPGPLARGHVPGGLSDSGGLPWAGRELRPTGFEGDRGEAHPALAQALGRYRGLGPAPTATQMDDTEAEVVGALAQARLLVPIVAVEEDGGADMAVTTLASPDGARALPVFSCVAALAAWRSDARPVPVAAALAVQAAFSEGCDVVLVDVAGSGGPFVLRPSMLWALGEGRPWRPGWLDERVRAAVAAAVEPEPDIRAWELTRGPGGATSVELALAPGLPRPHLEAVLGRLGGAVAADDETRLRLDGIGFRLRPASW